MPSDLLVMSALGATVMGSLLPVGAYRLIVRWMDRRQGAPLPGATQEVLEDMRRRVTELEERQILAQRLLARGRDGVEGGPGRAS
jgi:hypothetical protein